MWKFEGLKFVESARVFCDPRYDCLGGVAGEVIFAKIKVLGTSLFGDELHEKVYIT